MGFDAFGLPAEEHAIKTGEHPRVQTQRNIDNFTRQLKMLGFSYDWDRVVSHNQLHYFRWTQSVFVVLYDTVVDEDAQAGRPIADCRFLLKSRPKAATRFVNTRTSIAWPIRTMPWSTGVQPWEQCWLTRRSKTEKATVATIQSNGYLCDSGC